MLFFVVLSSIKIFPVSVMYFDKNIQSWVRKQLKKKQKGENGENNDQNNDQKQPTEVITIGNLDETF